MSVFVVQCRSRIIDWFWWFWRGLRCFIILEARQRRRKVLQLVVSSWLENRSSQSGSNEAGHARRPQELWNI